MVKSKQLGKLFAEQCKVNSVYIPTFSFITWFQFFGLTGICAVWLYSNQVHHLPAHIMCL